MWILNLHLCVLILQIHFSTSLEEFLQGKALEPRSRISGLGRTSGVLLDIGRCDSQQRTIIKRALRGVSQWSRFAMEAAPRDEEDAEYVRINERLLYETYFGPHGDPERQDVHRRFRLLRSEADNSPGGRWTLPRRSVVTINCLQAMRNRPLCQDPDALFDETVLATTVENIILASVL